MRFFYCLWRKIKLIVAIIVIWLLIELRWWWVLIHKRNNIIDIILLTVRVADDTLVSCTYLSMCKHNVGCLSFNLHIFAKLIQRLCHYQPLILFQLLLLLLLSHIASIFVFPLQFLIIQKRLLWIELFDPFLCY